MGQTSEKRLEQELLDYTSLCKKNYNNYKYKLWLEDNETDMLAYFFQFENIFKNFLKSVLKSGIYCNDDENRTKLTEEIINDLAFKRFRFPKVRVKTTEIENEKIMDLLIEGKNFVCVIENKMKAEENKGQCQAYKEEVYKLCKDGKQPICIYIDNEHSSICVSKKEFLKKNEVFGGYYLAYQGENVLASLLKCEYPKEIKQDLENFCNFLKEATLKEDSDLQVYINTKRTHLIEILKKNNYSVEYKKNYDDLYINRKLYEKYQYLELLCKTVEELKKKFKLN